MASVSAASDYQVLGQNVDLSVAHQFLHFSSMEMPPQQTDIGRLTQRLPQAFGILNIDASEASVQEFVYTVLTGQGLQGNAPQSSLFRVARIISELAQRVLPESSTQAEVPLLDVAENPGGAAPWKYCPSTT